MVYFYVIEKKKNKFKLRKSDNLIALRKKLYEDLTTRNITWEIAIHQYAGDVVLEHDVVYSVSTDVALFGRFIGAGYKDGHDILYYTNKSNRAYDLLPNGKLGETNRFFEM